MKGLIKWNGDEIVARVKDAARQSIDETTAAAAASAKDSHAYSSRTGRLEEQTVSEPATVDGEQTTGRFGTTKRFGFYGLFKERKDPFLRPAADREFPKLAERIAEKV